MRTGQKQPDHHETSLKGMKGLYFVVYNSTHTQLLLKKEINMSDIPQVQEQLPAPDFTLPVEGENDAIQDGKLHLADLRGKDVVLYFYPKED